MRSTCLPVLIVLVLSSLSEAHDMWLVTGVPGRKLRSVRASANDSRIRSMRQPPTESPLSKHDSKTGLRN